MAKTSFAESEARHVATPSEAEQLSLVPLEGDGDTAASADRAKAKASTTTPAGRAEGRRFAIAPGLTNSVDSLWTGIRARLHLAGQYGRSLCIAHWERGAGATTLAAALALRAATLEPTRDFCAVDLDQTDRGLSLWPQLFEARGIANVLRGECPLSEAIANTWLPNLSFVPAGTPPLTGTERERLVLWPDVLNCLRQDFQTVFVDLPRLCDEPALPLWAPRLGETLLVTSIGQRKYGLERAMTALHQASAEVLGIVVNAPSAFAA